MKVLSKPLCWMPSDTIVLSQPVTSAAGHCRKPLLHVDFQKPSRHGDSPGRSCSITSLNLYRCLTKRTPAQTWISESGASPVRLRMLLWQIWSFKTSLLTLCFSIFPFTTWTCNFYLLKSFSFFFSPSFQPNFKPCQDISEDLQRRGKHFVEVSHVFWGRDGLGYQTSFPNKSSLPSLTLKQNLLFDNIVFSAEIWGSIWQYTTRSVLKGCYPISHPETGDSSSHTYQEHLETSMPSETLQPHASFSRGDHTKEISPTDSIGFFPRLLKGSFSPLRCV